jgi:chromatin remodeling complex protein RSC6
MVRASKSDKQSAPAPTKVENVVVEKATKPKAKKVKETVVEVAAPVVPSTPVVEAAAPESSESSVALKINEFGAKLQQIASLFATMKSDFKTLEKSVSRELKNAQKSSSKKKKATGNRQPSGFVKPTRISDELAQFLGKTTGTEMARTEVSKEINAYIRAKGLQDKANGRKIIPDASLTKLLNLKSSDELTYFNLQRYMKHHFIKAVVATA